MKHILLIVMILALIIGGCKPKEVKMYEKAVASYSDEGQREKAVRLLKQSGDMGYGQSYAFLMEKEVFTSVQLLKMRTSYSHEEKIERVQAAIAAYERASEYLTLAKGKGWNDVSGKEKEIEAGTKKAEAELNVLFAESVMEYAKRMEDEKQVDAIGKVKQLRNVIEALGRAENLYSNAIAAGDSSQKEKTLAIQERVARLKSELLRAETQKAIEDAISMTKEKLKVAGSFNLDSALSLQQNLANANKCVNAVEAAAEACSLAADRGATNDVSELWARIDLKRLELSNVISKLTADIAAAEAEERRKQSAAYCIEQGEPLTVGAMREIVASLTYRSNTGNDIVDSQNEERERGKFKGMRAHVVGQIKRVDTGWFGGVNIWVTANGMSVKCGFGKISMNEGARYSNGDRINVVGTIDGTGGLMDDLSITNCSME